MSNRPIDRYTEAFILQGEHGKWLIATLTLLNSGALYGMASDFDAADRSAFPWFLSGVMAALACGFLTFLNYQLNATLQGNWADDENWRQPGLMWWTRATAYMSMGVGILSGLAFMCGALELAY